MWERPVMVTLTVDPKRFKTPVEAYGYVKEGRYIARLLDLLKVGLWVYVLEFQKNGWPHWHVMLDLAATESGWVDLKKAWILWRDKWQIGGLKMSAERTSQTVEVLLRYLTKYLLKVPVGGYPAWVLESKNMRFIQASRSLGALVRSGREKLERPAVDEVAQVEEAAVRSPRSLFDRLSSCRKHSALLFEDSSGRIRYVDDVACTPAQLAIAAAMGYGEGVEIGTRDYGNGRSCLAVSVRVSWRVGLEETVERLKRVGEDIRRTFMETRSPHQTLGDGSSPGPSEACNCDAVEGER